MSGPSIATRFALWPWKSIVIAAVIFLGACSEKSMPLRVTMPALPAEVAQPCPLPTPLPDGQVPTLIAALLDAWEGLAECEVRRAGAVRAYEAARSINNEVTP